jgi:signal transduction histidine kinase/putative methionine-R-sulfoxide reductase with GAF domain
MQSMPQMPILTDADLKNTDPRLLEALASLNQIGAAINRLRPRGDTGSAPSAVDRVNATLRLIVESATKVVPGASAVIYTYDEAQLAFDLESRVSAGESRDTVPVDQPRPEGIGARAIDRRRRVLSYEEADQGIHPAKVEDGAKAMACFPLVVAEQVVGVLYVYLHQDRLFSQLELLMLDNFVNQAAMAIYQARRLADVQQSLARKEDELTRLRRAGLLISSRLGLQETLEVILQMALEVTGAHYGIFRLVDERGQHLIAHAIAGEHLGRPQMEALPIDQTSIMGWVAEHRKPVRIHDLQAEPWSRIYYPLDADLKMRSELAVPLIGASGRLEGVLNLESPRVGAFSEQDSHLLQSLATQAVIAIQEVRLLDALQEVAQLLLVQPSREVLVRLVELACDLLNASASAIWTLEGDELLLQVASAGYQRGERLPLHGSLTGRAIVDRCPVTTDNVRTDPRFHRSDLAHAQDWDRALIVPLLASNDPEPIGAFSVYSTVSDPGRFVESVWDEKVLTCLAHYAALAVHNAARQEALRSAQEQHAVAETFAAVGDIAANVLHHLNNKVGTIPVRVQGIEDKCQSALLADVYLASNLSEIERSATEAMKTVRDSLTHLRPIRLQSVQVSACVDEAVAAARLPSDVQVKTAALSGLPNVRASQRSLALVFTNLLENAAEAMRGKGTVMISGTAQDGWVEMTVSDSGPGIAPELHDRIFEFDFSGRSSTQAGKLGFGLWWVKTLMVRLGGSIAVESDGQRGASFRLRLPCAQGQCVSALSSGS